MFSFVCINILRAFCLLFFAFLLEGRLPSMCGNRLQNVCDFEEVLISGQCLLHMFCVVS